MEEHNDSFEVSLTLEVTKPIFRLEDIEATSVVMAIVMGQLQVIAMVFVLEVLLKEVMALPQEFV